MLGEGTYAVIYRKGDLAIKEARDQADWIYIIREVAILQAMNHPNIIAIRELLSPISFAMDLYDTNLHDIMTELIPNAFVRYMIDIATGLAYVHSAGIIHCDINPTNMLVGANGAVLCDFGISRTAPSAPTSDVAYALLFRPPEVTYGGLLCAASDIWAMGVCILDYLCIYYKRPMVTEPDAVYKSMFRPLLAGNDPRKLDSVSVLAHFGKLFYMDWPLSHAACECFKVQNERPTAAVLQLLMSRIIGVRREIVRAPLFTCSLYEDFSRLTGPNCSAEEAYRAIRR